MMILNGLTLGLFGPHPEVTATLVNADAQKDQPAPKKEKPEIDLKQRKFDPFLHGLRSFI